MTAVIMLLRKSTLLLLVLSTPLGAQKARIVVPGNSEVRTVLVPDFCNFTVARIKEQTAFGRPGSMFAAIVPHGPEDGVVVTQSPAPNTPIVRGHSSLLVTLSKVQTANCSGAGQTATQTTSNSQELSRVPNLFGDDAVVATVLVAAAKLRPTLEGPKNGRVAQQSPQAGAAAKPGSEVILTLALPEVTVPLLEGKSLTEAIFRLQQSSLQLGPIDGPRSESSFVTGQALPAGVQVPSGTEVGVTVSAHAVIPPKQPQVAVPNLINKTASAAEADLASLDLRPSLMGGPSDGLVASQTVPPGTLVDTRSTLGFTLSGQQVVVPNVLGDTRAEAFASLRAFTLKPKITSGSAKETGSIVGTQSPASGISVAEAATVELSLVPPGTIPPVPPPPAIPVWVWPASLLAIAAVAAGIVFFRRPEPIRDPDPPFPPSPLPAICTLVPSTPAAQIKPGTPTGPALRFAITLQDRTGDPVYQQSSDPSVTLKG